MPNALSRAIADTADSMGIDPEHASPETGAEAEALRLFRILAKRDHAAALAAVRLFDEGATQSDTLEAMREVVAALPAIH
jgi:hypothetical protein